MQFITSGASTEIKHSNSVGTSHHWTSHATVALGIMLQHDNSLMPIERTIMYVCTYVHMYVNVDSRNKIFCVQAF